MIKRIVYLFFVWVLLELLHVAFYTSNLAFDIYILYPHPDEGRFLCNIFYDLSAHYAWIYLTYSLYIVLNYLRNIYTSDYNIIKLGLFAPYVKAIFIWRISEFILYLLFCNQSTNLISFPLLALLILLTYAKARKNT